MQNANNRRFWIRKNKCIALNSIKEQDDDSLIDKIYLYAKDLNNF